MATFTIAAFNMRHDQTRVTPRSNTRSKIPLQRGAMRPMELAEYQELFAGRDPDVIALSEIHLPFKGRSIARQYAKRFGYSIHETSIIEAHRRSGEKEPTGGLGMALLTKNGQASECDEIELGPNFLAPNAKHKALATAFTPNDAGPEDTEPVTLVLAYADYRNAIRPDQVRKLTEYLGTTTGPLVAFGDWNVGRRTVNRCLKRTQLARVPSGDSYPTDGMFLAFPKLPPFTVPIPGPFFALDHVVTNADRAAHCQAMTVKNPHSDHYGVVATVNI